MTLPTAPRFVPYYRVSTKRQGRSGLGLEAQRAAVAAYVNGHGRVLQEFVEVETGTSKRRRPVLLQALPTVGSPALRS